MYNKPKLEWVIVCVTSHGSNIGPVVFRMQRDLVVATFGKAVHTLLFEAICAIFENTTSRFATAAQQYSNTH